jgi:hypothetical protein
MQMQEALDRCEYAIKCQRDEIDRLRAELKQRDEELAQLLAWIDGDVMRLSSCSGPTWTREYQRLIASRRARRP